MTTAFLTDPFFLHHFSPGHPERPERLEAILRQLDDRGLRSKMAEIEPRDATEEEILAVHAPQVLSRQQAIAGRGGGWADADTYINAASPEIARRSAGAVLGGLEAVLGGEATNAFAAVRPPGHHATRTDLMGFCLLNNVAIATAAALQAGLQRVAIIDWDVHHGNGTQDIFDDEARVLHVSSHAAPFYPGTGAIGASGRGVAERTKINLPLPAESGDIALGRVYDEVVFPALERFEPELVIVSCGWDAHARDPLAPLRVSTEGYTALAAKVVEAADALCGGKLLVALEGGYDEHALAWCASGLVEMLLGEEAKPDPEPLPVHDEPDVGEVIAASRKELRLG